MRLAPYGVICGLAIVACFEHAPRRGPLAARADSIVPRSQPLRCRRFSQSVLLPQQAPHHACTPEADSTAVLYIGRSGRVLGLLESWANDSIGLDRATRTVAALSAQLGPPTYQGPDQHGVLVHAWRTDSLCVGVYVFPRETDPIQLSHSTVDFFGGCVN